MTLRVRCEVLKTIAMLDNPTSEDVGNVLPDLKPKQIQKAIYQLLTQDRIFKTGQQERTGSKGRARFTYEARDDWEPKAKETKSTETKAGRKNHSESMRTDGGNALGIVRFRDRKIRLLCRLADRASGSDKDLIIGILSDLGHKY